jgi:hypothetical protein
MRTKTLLIAAATLAAGLASSMAQAVYSQNVVGYVNVTLPANAYALIANQLNSTNNTIASLLPSVSPGTVLNKYNGGYTAYTFDEISLDWQPDGLATLNPGEGALVRNFDLTPQTWTFVGEVRQGSLTNAVPNGYSVRSSIVPQAGLITSVLGYPPNPGDSVNKYAGGYTTFTFDEISLDWQPFQPSFNVGEAFLAQRFSGGTNWVRNFTVN